jgi:hypothetical protein
MTKTKVESYVKERLGMDLCEFIKQKVVAEALYDYEIASSSSIKEFVKCFA